MTAFYGLVATLGVGLLSACQAEMAKLERTSSPRDSLGEEVYKVVCRRLAGTQFPDDVTGAKSETLCLGDQQTARTELTLHGAEYPLPLRALAERRERFVRAVNDTLPASLGSELEQLMRGLVPYYHPPDELFQRGTRSTAQLIEQLLQTQPAVQGATRLTRDGMVAQGTHNGLLRALVANEDVAAVLHDVLPPLLHGEAAAPFTAVREAAALELATSEPSDDHERVSMRKLLARADEVSPVDRFGTGQPLYGVRRDARGMPMVSKQGGLLPFPFVDGDGDGLADVKGESLVLDAAFTGVLPEPYPVLDEPPVARDAQGRACALTRTGSDCATLLYEYSSDRDLTFLSALLSEARGLFVGPKSILENAIGALPIVLEAPHKSSRSYGVRSHTYDGLPEQESVLLDLLHAGVAPYADARFDEGLALFDKILTQHEGKLAAALGPLLDMERRTRSDNDAYPEAVLRKGHIFWDELNEELSKLSRQRASQGSESAILGLTRATLGYARATEQAGKPMTRLMPLQQIAHLGALTALMMRFKDDWRPNPKPVSLRKETESATIGAFATPVDRSQPELPISCGKHGCGGPIVGSVFEPFRIAGQRCLIEQKGKRGLGDDCGAASNQSIFQRGLGLLLEAANRSQCNRAIGIGEIVDSLFSDPCSNLEDAPACTSDAQCAGLSIFRGADYACDSARKLCIAKPGTVTCDELKRDQRDTRNIAVAFAESAIAVDYACPADVPSAPCHAYEKTYPAAFIDPDGEGRQGAALQPCHAIDLPDVGRSFGLAVTREFTLAIPNPWVRRFLEDVARAGPKSATDDTPAIPLCDLSYRTLDPLKVPNCSPLAARATRAALSDIPADVDTLGELFEILLGDPSLFVSEADTRDLRPDPKILARVLFSPSTDEGVELFSPMLVRGAPPTCAEQPKLKACVVESADSLPKGCCIDADNPPLRYRLDTYYGSTTFAWEHPIAFDDGTTLSFLDAVRPVADAFNRIEAATPDLKRAEDQSYGLTRLGKLLSEHYDSARNPLTQNSDPNGLWYRQQTGLVNYERLFADLLDDGKMVPDQKGPHGAPLLLNAGPRSSFDLYTKSVALFEAIDGLSFGATRDGLDVASDTFALLANPHAWCAGERGDDRIVDGRGACHLGQGDGRRAPLSFRDGRETACFSDGRCFDGSSPTLPKRFASVLALLLEPLRTITSRGDALPDGQRAFSALVSGVLEQFLRVDNGSFRSPRAAALVSALVRYTRERWADEQAEKSLDSYAARTLADAADAITGPLGSALLRTLQALAHDGAGGRALSAIGEAALAPAQHRALLASLVDMLELPNNDAALLAFNKQLGAAFVPNVQRALSTSSEPLASSDGMVLNELLLLEKVAELDKGRVLARVLHNLTGANGTSAKEAPIEQLSEILFAVNRSNPQAHATLDSSDMSEVLRTVDKLLRDPKIGFERLYKIIQCATAPADRRCD